MNKQALSLAVFIAGAYPAASSALGLGDIQANSNLNQPFRATIPLSAAPADPSQIQVRLAPPEVFNRVGVARPEFLGSLRFQPTVRNGKPVILVSSDVPIQEPFVNFLLEVSWPQGKLLKEYSVMLDPPVLMQPGNAVEGGRAAVRAEPRAAGNVQRPTRRAAPAATPRAQQQAPRNRTYRVKPGDTLFKVASRLQQPGVSPDQMMMALFRANPNAFIDGNINNLRNGAVLKAPAAKEVNALSRAEARRQIRQQNAEWREMRQSLAGRTVPQQPVQDGNQKAAASGKPEVASSASSNTEKARLEVLGAKDGGAAKDAAVAAGGAGSAKLAELEKQLALANESVAARQKENEELKSRVADLESMLNKKNRLLELRDSQLAELQKKLSENGIQVPPLGNEPADQAAAAPAQPKPEQDLPTHVANATSQGGDTVLRADQTAQPAAASEPATGTATPPQQQASVPDAPKPFTPAGASTGTIPLKPPVEAPATPAQPEQPAIVPVAPADSAETKPAPAFADQADTGNKLLELLTSPLALQIGAGALALLGLLWLLARRRKTGEAEAKQIPSIEDENLRAVDSNELEGDLQLAEQRIRAAYGEDANPFGLEQEQTARPNTQVAASGSFAPQAFASESIISDDCLEEANVYIAYGLYQQAETELKKCIERKPEKLEYRHKLLECYFTANNREAFDMQAQQFASMEGANKAALWNDVITWGRKISPDNRLYQDAMPASGVAATVAAALGGVAAAVAAGGAAAHETKETVSSDTALPSVQPVAETKMEDSFNDLDLGDLDFDDLDLDKLLQDSSTETAKLEAAAGAEAVTADAGDLPLPTLATAAAKDDVEALPTVSTNAVPAGAEDDDFKLDFDFDELLRDQPSAAQAMALNGETPAVPQLDAAEDDGIFDFTDEVRVADAPAASAVEEAVPAMAAAPATNLNLHLDSKTGIERILPKDTFYAPLSDEDKNWLGDIDDALSFLDFPEEEIDLHEAHISTKLDLARAYLDMGDIEGARSTLEEVMVEGNDEQRREAEILLHQTG